MSAQHGYSRGALNAAACYPCGGLERRTGGAAGHFSSRLKFTPPSQDVAPSGAAPCMWSSRPFAASGRLVSRCSDNLIPPAQRPA